MSTSRAQKIRLGIFAIITATAAVIVLGVFAGLHIWQRHDRYTVYFDDSVLGLEEGAIVTFGGIKAGTVDHIEVDPADLRRIKVTIEVKRGLPIRTDTTATLQFAGITGLKVIDLRGGDVRSPHLPPGSTIATGATILDRVEQEADNLITQSRQLMDNANKVMANLAAITDPGQFEGVGALIDQAKQATANLAALTNDLRGVLGDNRVALRNTVTSIERAANSANSLVRDNAVAVRTSLFDLRQAARSFKELARELRQKPSRLFFADAPRDRKLP